MPAIKDAMKAAYGGEGNGEAEVGMDYADDNGAENNDYDYDEDRAAADGKIAGPEGGEEHEGKTMMMDRTGMAEKKGRDLDGDGDVDSDDWKKARDRKIKQSMKRDKPKKSQQYEAKGGKSGTPLGQEVGSGPGGGSKEDKSKAKDWNGTALGDETGGGPGGGNKTEFGQKPTEDGGSNLLPANDRGSSLGAHGQPIKSKDASLNPQNKKPLAAEGKEEGPSESKKRLDENIMLGLSAIPGTYLGNSDMSQFEIDPDDPDADIKEMRRRSGIEEWWKV